MKINIGPFNSDIIPVRDWERNYEYMRRPETCYLAEKDHTKIDKFVFGFFDALADFVRPLNRWSNNRARKVEVRIDNYDVWSADHTLGLIIAPVLKKLKEAKAGSPFVDDEDVPENLRSTAAPPKEHEWDTDDNHFLRWDYVLDEMIWAFEQHSLEDSTAQFHHNVDQIHLNFEPLPDDSELSGVNINKQKDTSKPAYWRDDDGIAKHEARMDNGRMLFAKYYCSLWD